MTPPRVSAVRPDGVVLSAGAPDAHHRALIRKETLSNTIATTVIAIVLTWLIFHSRQTIAVLTAPPGGAFGIIPGTFNFTLLVTIVLTLITRARVGKRQVRRATVPQTASGHFRAPANVLLRGLVFASIACIVFSAVTYASLWLLVRSGLVPAEWPLWGMLVLFTVHFTALSCVITPIVVWRALQD